MQARNPHFHQIVDWPGKPTMAGDYRFVLPVQNNMVRFFGGFESAVQTQRKEAIRSGVLKSSEM